MHRTTIDTPLGRLTLVADDRGLRAVLWPDDAPGRVRLGECVDVAVDDDPVLAEAARQLHEYFAGERLVFDLPLAPEGTPFQRDAWAVLETIPYGSSMSYGEQAARLGDPNKARAVGAANGRNPLSIVVPCHRVRGADGGLTGFAGGTDAKAWLLAHEQAVLAARG